MLTTMFRKTLTVYLSVTIIAFSILTFAVHFEIKHFLTMQRLQVLSQEANAILPILERVNGNPRFYPAYDKVVSRYKTTYDVTVNLLLVRNSGLQKIEKLTNQLVKHNDILNALAVQNVLAGQEIQAIGPFSKKVRESTLIVGVPIQSNGEVVGALFLHTPVQELQLGQVTEIILLISIPILLLSMLTLYFTSRRFSYPLLKMHQAVQSIGKGNFRERIDVHSQDEVGQLADAFNHMAIQLERLENMRKDLIANVSHEIRTPLTSVRGFIQGILDGVISSEEQNQYLQIAFIELERLGTILNTMLDLSAIETGRITIDLHPVRWAQIVENVKERVNMRVVQKGIELNTYNQDETVTILGDAERMTQVVFNIVDNAIRHTSSGGISITSDVLNGKLRVQIRDTGEGILPEHLFQIWERFFTGSMARTSNQSRTGLGLTITKSLVELMHGQIEVESIPSRGTTFILYFPVFSSSTYS